MTPWASSLRSSDPSQQRTRCCSTPAGECVWTSPGVWLRGPLQKEGFLKAQSRRDTRGRSLSQSGMGGSHDGECSGHPSLSLGVSLIVLESLKDVWGCLDGVQGFYNGWVLSF